MIQYEDFSIKIEPQREGVYPVIVLRSPAGEGRSSFRLPFDPDDLGDLLVDLGQAVRGDGPRPTREAAPGATRTRPQQVGDQLFNALFAGPVRSLLDQSLGMIRERQKGLRIKLHIDPEDASLARLASLPWELMYRKETRDFLNLSRYTPIVRYLDVQVPYIPLALEPPLRILVIISNPVDYARLNLEHERSQIERTWAQKENVEVSFLETPTISTLQDRLEREPFHALHYMGHGGFDRHSGSGVLFLEDGNGYGSPVDGRTLGVLLRDVPTLRLVFLNACETARVTKQVGLDPFAGVAAAIVMAGVPAVVAMQFPISDVAAIRFAGRFYPLVALGEPVDYAVAEGRRAIRVAESDTMEWATPVLFMRAPDGVLFRVAEAHLVTRPQLQPPALDREQEKRLEELYISGLGAFWLEEWDRACHHFQEIVDERPDYKDASARLEEAERKWQQSELYNQAQEARQAGNWTVALTRLEKLVAEDPGYKDAAALLEMARRQRRLADLYDQARQLHQAGHWLAVARVFDQIATLDPDFPDPDDLLATARQETAEQEQQAALNDLYRRAVLEMDAGRWEGAQELLTRLLEGEPGYREADRLLVKAQTELRRQGEERQRQEQIAALYDQAVNRAGSGQWAQALAAMDDIRALDPEFADPQGVAARARDEVERQQEAESQPRESKAGPDIRAVRDLLLAAFTAQDLRRFIRYTSHTELRPLLQRFSPNDGLEDMVDETVEFCSVRALLPDLLRGIQEANPRRYEEFKDRLAGFPEYPPAEQPKFIQSRRIDAAVPAQAQLNDSIDLIVQARLPNSPFLDTDEWPAKQKPAQVEQASKSMDVAFPVDRRTGAPIPAHLQVRVVAPGFVVEGADRKLMVIPPDRSSEPVSFLLTPQRLGNQRINVEVCTPDDTCVSTIEVETIVGEVTSSERKVASVTLVLVVSVEGPVTAYEEQGAEIARHYQDAVRLLQTGQYQAALQEWERVLSLDPQFPDPEGVAVRARRGLETEGKEAQPTALKKPAARARPALWRRLPRGAWLAIGAVALVAVLVAGGAALWPLITATPTPTPTDTVEPTDTPAMTPIATSTHMPAPAGGPPVPDLVSTNPVTGTVWEWSDGSSMVCVPAGTFWMGTSDEDIDAILAECSNCQRGWYTYEQPQHAVTLDAFWIDRTEVTNAQYRRCVDDGACSPPSSSASGTRDSYYAASEFDDYPVIYVNWAQANSYCTWTGKRLPTEAEWEKAARGTDKRLYPWGYAFNGSLVNFCDVNCTFDSKAERWDDSYLDTSPVGNYPGNASPYGALDMAGNVWEWVADWYSEDYYASSPDRNPQGPDSGQWRAKRGGSWGDDLTGVRSAIRHSFDPTDSDSSIGFRCARSASEP